MSRPRALMRWRMRRRSVSSLVSPGPRVPMPPPSRDNAAPAPTSRGNMYFSCASSTCSLPSRVRARREKMSRMSCVRSTTLRSRRSLEVSELRRRQLVVEDHDVGAGLDAAPSRACRALPRAEKRRGIRLRTLLEHAQDDRAPRPLPRGRPARRARDRDRCVPSDRLTNPTSAVARGHRAGGLHFSDSSTAAHGIAPSRSSRGVSSRTSTIVDGIPPRIGTGVDHDIDIVTERRGRPLPHPWPAG